MAIEKINITNTAITPQNIKKEVAPPEIKPENKPNKNKLIYGTLGALAVLGTATTLIYKVRKGQLSNLPPFHPTPTQNSLSKLEKVKNLYSGVETTLSKNGHKLETTWKDGKIVSRTFTPNAQRAEKVGFVKLDKKYDYDAMQNIIVESNIRTLADGSKVGAYSARFKQTKFAPEIESKIKMKDFDKLNYGDEIAGATKKVNKDGSIVYDLGDDVFIIQHKDKYENITTTLARNGEDIRNLSVRSNVRFISQENEQIYLHNGNFGAATKYDHKNNIFTTYDTAGTVVRSFTNTPYPWRKETTNLLDTIK